MKENPIINFDTQARVVHINPSYSDDKCQADHCPAHWQERLSEVHRCEAADFSHYLSYSNAVDKRVNYAEMVQQKTQCAIAEIIAQNPQISTGAIMNMAMMIDQDTNELPN